MLLDEKQVTNPRQAEVDIMKQQAELSWSIINDRLQKLRYEYSIELVQSYVLYISRLCSTLVCTVVHVSENS